MMKAPIIILFVVVTLFSVPGWSQPSVPRIQNPQITRPRQPDTKLNTNPSRPRPQTSGRPTIAPSDTTTTRVPPCGSCPDQVEITCRDLHRAADDKGPCADDQCFGLVIMGTACPDNIRLVIDGKGSETITCVEDQIVIAMRHICGPTGQTSEMYVYGSGGDDRIDGDLIYDVHIDGGVGNDNLRGGMGEIHGGTGNDEIFVNTKPAYGDEGNDKISGSGMGEIFGGTGNDEIIVNHFLSPGVLNKTIFGGDGDDCIDVQLGVGVVNGGEGNDLLSGNGGEFNGENGDDRIEITSCVGPSYLQIRGGDGNDRLLNSGCESIDRGALHIYDEGGDDYVYSTYATIDVEAGPGSNTFVVPTEAADSMSLDLPNVVHTLENCSGSFCNESFYRPRNCVGPTW